MRVGTVPPLASAFQPRAGLREEIDRARERNATVVLTQVLSGGGGVGKSQLAAHYADRAHTEGVDVLVWVNAAETSQIITAYAEAARAVGEDAEQDAAAFLKWLAVTGRSWLVVLNDLTDLEGTGPWWPRPPAGANGRVLATTAAATPSSPGTAVPASTSAPTPQAKPSPTCATGSPKPMPATSSTTAAATWSRRWACCRWPSRTPPPT
ncbi:hypothetical protein OG196_04385 [Kitasatospora purpeofusca]|uniref:hypothetical protein n=1 Tax=Kitasatospora purpeofusca TaxID=67352 RepID=UPI002E0F8A75|nr:hypothetical protein OG196_04385 [Kitasatospora purpeofusca]